MASLVSNPVLTVLVPVYARRGWDANGIPTLEKLRALGIDFPDVVEVVERRRSELAG